MKRYILGMILAALFLPTGLFAQEPEQEEAEFQRAMRERQMELQQREAQMNTERRMQELELEKRRIELEHLRRKHDEKDNDELHPLLLLLLVVNILVAVWVYLDIRQRGRGSGIWIVIALLTGLIGTLVYAVVRLGDGEKEKA